MKLNIWLIAVALLTIWYLYFRQKSYYNVVSDAAYADWMGKDGHIFVPTGAKCNLR
jgi:hypothetical protein